MTGRGLFYLSFVLVAAGVACFAAGMLWRNRLYRQRRRKGRTVASVVRLELQEAGSGTAGPYHNRYHPVLQYYAGGQLYECVHPEGAYPSRWEKGQKISVDYDLHDPSDYELSIRDRDDIRSALLYYGGIGFLALGFFLFILYALR